MNSNLRNILLVTVVTTGIALYNYYSDPKNRTVTFEPIPGLAPEASIADSNRADTSSLTPVLKNYTELLKTKQLANDKAGEADVLLKIGNVYARQNKTEQAVYYYTHALEINEALNNKVVIADLNYAIATVYSTKGTTDTAQEFFIAASKAYSKIGDKQSADSCLQKLNRMMNK